MMVNKRTLLLYGFLFINSIHWGGVVLTAILNNIVGMFVEYYQLPWFRLVILTVEIIIFIKLLDYKTKDKSVINTKSLLKLMIISIALFIGAQFDYYFDYTPGFCGNALFDGSLDDLFDARNQNLIYVHVVETFLLSLGLIVYILKQIRQMNN